jgi:hypothetical protein
MDNIKPANSSDLPAGEKKDIPKPNPATDTVRK